MLNEKIIKIKNKFYETEIKKSGKNKMFQYFELKDFLPNLVKLMAEEEVNDVFTIDNDFARLKLIHKDEVNEFLDDVIKDYETYAALVKELREENARLREELAQKAQETPQTSPIASTATQEYPQVTTATNFDILKRLNRLEKEVFGKQIVDRDY